MPSVVSLSLRFINHRGHGGHSASIAGQSILWATLTVERICFAVLYTDLAVNGLLKFNAKYPVRMHDTNDTIPLRQTLQPPPFPPPLVTLPPLRR